ncbi:transposase [Collimonas fungivorans]|uniref:transposase n=1 Tax=Collimonas fungivorans TaxID=158899 RepID=UPI0011D2BE3E
MSSAGSPTRRPSASGATISRFEHPASRQDICRISEALVEQFIASFSSPPKNLILDLDHSEDVGYQNVS